MEAHTRHVRATPGARRRIVRTALVLVCSAALTGTLGVPASAAETVATVEVSTGSLGFRSAPTSASLGAVDQGADAAITLRGTTVTDNRAGTAGWTATVVLTEFIGEATGARLSAAGATYSPTAAATTGSVAVAPSTATDPTTPKVIQTATCVTGNNTATWNADLTLHVPNGAVADAYTTTLTYSVS
jgi:hypothetical protein